MAPISQCRSQQMAAHLTRSDCEGSNAVDKTDDDTVWNH